jgi:hypothetical protein
VTLARCQALALLSVVQPPPVHGVPPSRRAAWPRQQLVLLSCHRVEAQLLRRLHWSPHLPQVHVQSLDGCLPCMTDHRSITHFTAMHVIKSYGN